MGRGAYDTSKDPMGIILEIQDQRAQAKANTITFHHTFQAEMQKDKEIKKAAAGTEKGKKPTKVKENDCSLPGEVDGKFSLEPPQKSSY